MYKAQAEHYRREASNLAEAYPLLAPGVDKTAITKSEIGAVELVGKLWLDVAVKLRKIKEGPRG
jgi:hypothetical protein